MALNTLRNIHLLDLIYLKWNRVGGRNVLHTVFKLICILTTLALVIWCAYEFNENEDISEIIFKTFHEDKDSIYPELTVGVLNRFNETALREYDKGFNGVNYRKYFGR